MQEKSTENLLLPARQWLDFMILEVFSNLNDSMILMATYFYLVHGIPGSYAVAPSTLQLCEKAAHRAVSSRGAQP